MSDPLPAPPPVGAPIAYRPISGFAIAGFAAACLLGLLMLGMAAVALYQGAPFYLPIWAVLPAAVVAAGLSLLARGQIRNSEGTQAGEKLAGAGIWLSLLTGLGYGVYYYVTMLAVTSQANAFLTQPGDGSGFFPHLQNAAESKTDLHAAFLLTLPPTARGAVRPEDELGMLRQHDQSKPDGSAGQLTLFRKHPLVRLVVTAPPGSVHVEPLGVQNWDYENRSYTVRRGYRITTPEAEVEFSLPAASSEGEAAGEQRRWFVPLQVVGKPSEKNIKLTKLGDGLQRIRNQSRGTLFLWKNALNEGQPFAFAQKDATNWERLPLAETQRGYVKGALQDLFAAKRVARLGGLMFFFEQESGLGDWKKTEDAKWQMAHDFRLTLVARGAEPAYSIEGQMVMETAAALDPTALSGAPGEVACDIRHIIITRAAPQPEKKGPPPPPP